MKRNTLLSYLGKRLSFPRTIARPGFIRGQNQRRTLHILNHVGNGEGFTQSQSRRVIPDALSHHLTRMSG